jgi:hypothetical protein
MTFAEHPPTSDDEREALGFLKTGRKLRGLSPTQFQRIGQRLASPRGPTRYRRLLPVLAALGLVLLAGAAVAHVVGFSRLPFISSLFPSRESGLASKSPRSHVQPADVTATPPVVAPAPERTRLLERAEKPQAPVPPAPLPTPAARSNSRRNLGLAPPKRAIAAKAHEADREMVVPNTPSLAPAPSPPVLTPVSERPSPSKPIAEDDPISAESRSFSAALAQWHRDHNAEAALAALDVHERRFPRGQIRLEAKLLRAEILLQQDRGREALSLLDSVSLSGLPRGRELQTVRGELRVKYGRCPEGRRDLDHVLMKDRADSLGRRAARAISLCP